MLPIHFRWTAIDKCRVVKMCITKYDWNPIASKAEWLYCPQFWFCGNVNKLGGQWTPMDARPTYTITENMKLKSWPKHVLLLLSFRHWIANWRRRWFWFVYLRVLCCFLKYHCESIGRVHSTLIFGMIEDVKCNLLTTSLSLYRSR